MNEQQRRCIEYPGELDSYQEAFKTYIRRVLGAIAERFDSWPSIKLRYRRLSGPYERFTMWLPLKTVPIVACLLPLAFSHQDVATRFDDRRFWARWALAVAATWCFTVRLYSTPAQRSSLDGTVSLGAFSESRGSC